MKDSAEKAIQELLKDKNPKLQIGNSESFEYGRL